MIDSQMNDMIKEKLALKEQVDSLEQNLSKQIKEKECLLETFNVFQNKSKEKENKYQENEIDLEKKIKELDNIIYKVGQSAQTVHMLTKPQAFYDNIHKQALGYQNPFYLKKAQRIKPTLYDGVVISNTHVAMPVIDDEETLILEDESRSKMSEKAKDPEVIAKKISHKPIDYEKLNRLSKDFKTRFTPQQELSAEQAFWFHILNPTIEPSYSPPVIVDVPSELPKVSLVNASLKKLKFHLAQFDSVVKKRTTPSALEEGEWGFEHTKTVFNNEIIPFLKSLKDIFNVFDKDLLNEITEVQTVFDQMEVSVQQSSVNKQCVEITKKELLLENDRLLHKIMSQDVMITVMNSMSVTNESTNMEMQICESCDKFCILMLISNQLNQEIFQKDESCINQNALEILEYFEKNDLKAQLQDKDTTICKLKDIIKSIREISKDDNVNNDLCELETKNVELENSVAKLFFENERLCKEINHLKQVFKDQFDSIKKTRVRTKEQSDFLIDQLNLKSAKNEDLEAQIQDKLDLEPLPPRLLQNREVHIDYLRNTQEQANILREIVEQAKAKQPLDGELDLACKYTTRIQELLVYVQDTCPNAITPNTRKVAVTPMNNVKKVRFTEPLISLSNSKQVESSNTSDSNTPMLSSTGVKCFTRNCRSKPPGNKKNDRISQTPSRNKKNKVEAQPRKVNNSNRVVKPVCDVDVKHSLSNTNSEILCATCNKSMFDGVHGKFLLDLVQNWNKHTKSAKKHKKQNIWKPMGHVFTEVGFKWKPIGKTFTIFGNSCPLTRFTSTNVVQIVLWYLDSECSKHMTGNRSQLMNFVSKFLGTVRFGNDQIARIMGYGDYQLGNVITRDRFFDHFKIEDGDADDVDVHLYRSMIGSLMYLTASRPDIIDYAGATQDRKSTTGGCQFLGNRLISWQCKKQTVVATSTTEAEYVAAASCCGQVLWIQNQLLDYGYNFMNTVINIDNNSTICIIENPVQHSKTKHIEIRHHFIRDCNAKKLIQMVKIHTDYNVADLLTKGFDAGRFQYLVSSIGMLNP
ncbi:hypothetical protein Tco_0003817 [Tanacetum coccineum]